MSLPLRLLLHFALTALLLWVMLTYLEMYISITGGWWGIATVAALITLMDVVVRPVLVLLMSPLRLFATMLASIIVNGMFLWIAVRLVLLMNPDRITMAIHGGLIGWAIVVIVFGFANWLMKAVVN